MGKRREKRIEFEAAHLSEDIVVEILSKLPIKSLCRFKCVCKSWRSLISEAKFSLSAAGRQRAIVCGYPRTSGGRDRSAGEGWRNFYALDPELSVQNLPCWVGKLLSGNDSVFFVGTCNGLILFCTGDSMYLWNPSTRCCRGLPHLNFLIRRVESMYYRTISGLYYDESSRDYKVVFVTLWLGQHPGIIRTVYVASLRKGIECKGISFPYTLPRFSFWRPGILLRGHLHWLVEAEMGDSQVIVYFDEAKNQFCQLPLPGEQIPGVYFEMNGYPRVYFELAVLDGCLCVSTESSYGYDRRLDGVANDVLIMREYGVKESWTKLFTIPGVLVPLNIRKSSDLVLVANYRSLYTYNLRNECRRFVKVLQGRDPSPDNESPYNLRKKCPRKIKLEPVPLFINVCPLMYVESLAPVHWPEQ